MHLVWRYCYFSKVLLYVEKVYQFISKANHVLSQKFIFLFISFLLSDVMGKGMGDVVNATNP